MDTPCRYAADVTFVALVDGDDPGTSAALLDRLGRALAGSGARLLAVGHGDRDGAAGVVRAAAAREPTLVAVLHCRRVDRREAFCVAVEAARTRWIVATDPRSRVDPAAIARLLATRPEAAALRGEPGVGMLFARERFLALPRIPAMLRWLPELFARGDGRRPAGPWLRRAWVALLCRMAVAPPPAPGGRP